MTYVKKMTPEHPDYRYYLLNHYQEDYNAIVDAVRSFNGKPVTINEVRRACRFNGHPIDHLKGASVAGILRKFCVADGNIERRKHHLVHWKCEE